jgi:hypothetical protein
MKNAPRSFTGSIPWPFTGERTPLAVASAAEPPPPEIIISDIE